jgi:hypothetical protein
MVPDGKVPHEALAEDEFDKTVRDWIRKIDLMNLLSGGKKKLFGLIFVSTQQRFRPKKCRFCFNAVDTIRGSNDTKKQWHVQNKYAPTNLL